MPSPWNSWTWPRRSRGWMCLTSWTRNDNKRNPTCSTSEQLCHRYTVSRCQSDCAIEIKVTLLYNRNSSLRFIIWWKQIPEDKKERERRRKRNIGQYWIIVQSHCNIYQVVLLMSDSMKVLDTTLSNNLNLVVLVEVVVVVFYCQCDAM